MADLVREAFGSATAYEILGVERTADAAAIRKAYFKQALQWHPDKNKDPEATKKFQALSFIHSVLSDETKRKDYDRSGSFEDVSEAGDDDSFELWYEYWRRQFPAVTLEQILKYEETFRGSAQEREDVLAAYQEVEGDMDNILERVVCSRDEDAERFAAMIHDALAAGAVPAFPAFTTVYGDKQDAKLSRRAVAAQNRARQARTERAAAEAAEAEEMLAEMREENRRRAGKDGAAAAAARAAPGSTDELQALILANRSRRAEGFESLLGSLEAKYARPGKHGRGRAVEEEEDDIVHDKRKPGKKAAARKSGKK